MRNSDPSKRVHQPQAMKNVAPVVHQRRSASEEKEALMCNSWRLEQSLTPPLPKGEEVRRGRARDVEVEYVKRTHGGAHRRRVGRARMRKTNPPGRAGGTGPTAGGAGGWASLRAGA